MITKLTLDMLTEKNAGVAVWGETEVAEQTGTV
jgi:hypothetical protein